MAKIKVKNTTNGTLTVIVPEIPFRHDWLGNGASYDVEENVLKELMYDPGFKYMIDTGMLYIEDMEAKKELDIEPQDATEPVNVIVLTDKQRRQYMVNLPLTEFKEKVGKLSREQILQLADYAIKNRLADFDKANYLKDICGKDVIQAIRLGDQAKEV